MGFLTIDRDKCKRDGICIKTCPMGIIGPGAGGFPSGMEGADSFCITCGHCVAVCPQGALSLGSMKEGDCLPIPGEGFVSPEQAAGFLTSRRSIRTYREKPVDRETLAKIIDIARYGPSGHNSQPVSWLVIEDTNEVRRLSGMVIEWMRFMIQHKPEIAIPLHLDRVVEAWEGGQDKVCRGAPHVIVAHAPESAISAPQACTIALAYLELAAYSTGLGACWAGYFSVAASMFPPMKTALALPSGHQNYGAMMIGYPKYRYHRIPQRKQPFITWR